MQIAKAHGLVFNTPKAPNLGSIQFLLLQRLDHKGQPLPKDEMAADRVSVEIEEWSLVSRGSAPRQEPGDQMRPPDASGVGHHWRGQG